MTEQYVCNSCSSCPSLVSVRSETVCESLSPWLIVYRYSLPRFDGCPVAFVVTADLQLPIPAGYGGMLIQVHCSSSGPEGGWTCVDAEPSDTISDVLEQYVRKKVRSELRLNNHKKKKPKYCSPVRSVNLLRYSSALVRCSFTAHPGYHYFFTSFGRLSWSHLQSVFFNVLIAFSCSRLFVPRRL